MTSSSGVRTLADSLGLNEAERQARFLMNIVQSVLAIPANGFLDETEGNDIVGVGGWLGTYDSWHTFETRWKALLPPEANEDFHYTDFWHDPTYWSARWSLEKRLEFIQSLAALVAQHASIGLGIVISNSEYERVVPEELKRKVKGSVYFCLAHCLRLLMTRYTKISIKPPSPLRFMHDSKQGREGWIADWYYSVRNFFPENDILGDLSFGRREKEPVLQAADLLVGELRRHRQGHPSKVMEIIRQKRSILVGFPTEDDLQAIVEAALADPD